MKEYIAKKIDSDMSIDDIRWDSVPEAKIDCVWKNSYPSPYNAIAKMVHGDNGYTILFITDEWPLVARCSEENGDCCKDSCLEFFFTPNDTDKEYINCEINPIGMLHLGYGTGRGKLNTLISSDGEIEITSRIRAGKEWRVLLNIPYSFIRKHYSSFGNVIRWNFYKCGDSAPIIHYAAWSPIDTPAPDYHQPKFFGKIILSDEKL